MNASRMVYKVLTTATFWMPEHKTQHCGIKLLPYYLSDHCAIQRVAHADIYSTEKIQIITQNQRLDNVSWQSSTNENPKLPNSTCT